MKVEPHLYCWMLHHQRLVDLIDEPRVLKILERVGWLRTSTELQLRTRELDRWLRTHEVPSLEVLLNRREAPDRQLVWLEAPFEWSRVVQERRQLDVDPMIRSSFTVDLAVEGRTVRVHGTFSPRHLTCSSANSELAGVRSQYMLGTFAYIDDNSVELRPVAIADRFLVPPEAHTEGHEWQRTSPRQVDQFSHIDFDSPIETADLAELRDVPEREMKEILADLIGERVVPKDWGGEQMDLWTTRLRVNGVELSAAFLLKGPAAFRPMTMSTLGKNGDQLDRLARSPADILVLQHCHEITPAVISNIRAYVSDYRNVRRFLVIDGYDSLRIVRSYRDRP